jgi:acetyl esterase/lipase
MSVYLPTRRTATGQAIVVCPGGGYRVLAYDWEGVDIAKWLNANGIAAIVLKYRLPIAFHDSQKHRFALQDAQQAIRLTRQHATEWNISRDKIGVMGFSAGGHVAALLGTRHDCCAAPKGVAPDSTTARPNFMILLYPVVTMARPYAHLGSRSALLGDNPDTIAIQDYSPELHVRNTTPPAFLVHASDDTSVHVENSILFFRALRTHDVPAELHIYHAGGHGFSLATGRRSLHSWTYRCLDWLAQLDSQARDQ